MEFLSGYAKIILEQNHPFCNKDILQQMENMCEEFFLKKKEEYESRVAYKPSADTVIQRIRHYYGYAMNKESPKMRFTKKEYEEAVGRLDEEEKQKIVQWLEEHGGYDKYIFNGFGG